jgi:hypothetical protein
LENHDKAIAGYFYPLADCLVGKVLKPDLKVLLLFVRIFLPMKNLKIYI